MKRRVLFITLILSILSLSVKAQDIESLKSEIKRAEREIAATNKMLNNVKTKEKNSQKELRLVQSKITQRKSIVKNLDKQGVIIKREIEDKSSSVNILQKDLRELKREYSKMIYNAYKHYKFGNYLAFILSAKDFNDIFRRIYYIKQYTKMRERKANEMIGMSDNLQSEVNNLNSEQERLEKVMQAKNREIKTLASEETTYRNMVATLKNKKSQLSKDLKANRNTINNLQKKIQQIIAEEARKARAKAKKQTPAQSQQDVILTGRFDQNMGKLPYPVDGGVVVDSYGIHPHPTQTNLKIDNKGINISANSCAPVKAVFDGEVSRIFFFKGLNNTVMIRHGDYITVYSNLQNISVKVGDKISTNQTIGTLADDLNAELHFEIWRESENLNPSKWLRR